jgi:hypothetical protein
MKKGLRIVMHRVSGASNLKKAVRRKAAPGGHISFLLFLRRGAGFPFFANGRRRERWTGGLHRVDAVEKVGDEY